MGGAATADLRTRACPVLLPLGPRTAGCAGAATSTDVQRAQPASFLREGGPRHVSNARPAVISRRWARRPVDCVTREHLQRAAAAPDRTHAKTAPLGSTRPQLDLRCVPSALQASIRQLRRPCRARCVGRARSAQVADQAPARIASPGDTARTRVRRAHALAALSEDTARRLRRQALRLAWPVPPAITQHPRRVLLSARGQHAVKPVRPGRPMPRAMSYATIVRRVGTQTPRARRRATAVPRGGLARAPDPVLVGAAPSGNTLPQPDLWRVQSARRDSIRRRRPQCRAQRVGPAHSVPAADTGRAPASAASLGDTTRTRVRARASTAAQAAIARRLPRPRQVAAVRALRVIILRLVPRMHGMCRVSESPVMSRALRPAAPAPPRSGPRS